MLIWAIQLNRVALQALVLAALSMLAHAGWADDEGSTSGFDTLANTPYFACASCHGWRGEGVPSIGAPAIAGLEEKYILEQLNAYANGRRGAHTQDFFGAQMSLIAKAYTDDLRRQLAALVASIPLTRVSSEWKKQGDVESGRALYAACSSCHGRNGEGKPELLAPALAGFTPNYLYRQLNNYKNAWRGGENASANDQTMRTLVQGMLKEDQQIIDLVSYISAELTRK